jgi:hypothetical protein
MSLNIVYIGILTEYLYKFTASSVDVSPVRLLVDIGVVDIVLYSIFLFILLSVIIDSVVTSQSAFTLQLISVPSAFNQIMSI